MKKKLYVLSVGGSLIVPESGKIGQDFLKKLLFFLEKELKKGNKFIIVAGGGKTARDYIKGARAVKKVSDKEADYLGILSTRLNANLLKTLLGNKAFTKVLDNPNEEIKTNKIIIAGGYKPGQSTDAVATQLAVTYGALEVINLSNIDYVYDKDPKLKGAKKIENLTWNELFKITGRNWQPGKNTPFDPVASKIAQKNNLKVIMISGKDFKSLNNYFQGKKFRGTVVS
ncbi:MAG: UMP kinase [Candidatus Pacebacteria bacterium]|nr:UMP kinase [Candidatus Paceibacterota bacterium]